jgi:hypothetical protein
MPREGCDGSERYDDGGEPGGPSSIPWPRPNRLVTLGAARDGARVNVTMSMARDDGHAEAVPVRERCGPGQRWVAWAPRCQRRAPEVRTPRRGPAQGPSGTALRVEDSPAG